MTNSQTLLAALLDDPAYFFCQLGYFLEGNRTNGVKVRFYPTGVVRELTVFVDGFRSFSGQYYSNKIPSHFINYREGIKHGEAIYCLNSGLVRKHVLYGPSGEVRATEDLMRGYPGYLVSQEKMNLFAQFEPFGRLVRRVILQSL